MEHTAKSVNNFSPKSEWKRPTRGKRHSCENNIKTDFKAVGCQLVDWAYLRQDSGVVESTSEHFGTFSAAAAAAAFPFILFHEVSQARK